MRGRKRSNAAHSVDIVSTAIRASRLMDYITYQVCLTATMFRFPERLAVSPAREENVA
jgi:hypothetical protein